MQRLICVIIAKIIPKKDTRMAGENHKSHRIGWLRAAVLGANDGIVSTASLVIGIAASHADRSSIILAAVAGLSAGAMSMAAGEYVSVSSQADTQKADLEIEKRALTNDRENEIQELAEIYEDRGLDEKLARKVAISLMEKDALGAHAKDELGFSAQNESKPIQAAFSSAAAFTIGALMPLLAVMFSSQHYLIVSVCISSLFVLGVLGAIAAQIGGASIIKGGARVIFWGSLAMAVTAGAGRLFGVFA